MTDETVTAIRDVADRVQPALADCFPRFRLPVLASCVMSGNPDQRSAQGVILRADIAGFTGLTDQFAEMGQDGAERLAGAIADFVSSIEQTIAKQGGELVNLAGDAVIAMWVASEDELLESLLLAVQAGLSIAKERSGDGPEHAFRTRVSVGVGRLHHFEVGGLEGQWHAVVAGPAMADALEVGGRIAPEQLGLSIAAWNMARNKLIGGAEGDHAVVLGIAGDCPIRERQPRQHSMVSEQLLRASLSPTVLDAVRARGRGHWSGEFRRVSAVFVLLRLPGHADPADALEALQDATVRIQSVANRYEGHLHQVRADDGGVTAIVAFGLPPMAHEDDAARAVEASLALSREWGSLGVSSSTGIATGRVFATVVGQNAMFTLVGPVMNLAARLMALNAGVVCDEQTAAAGRNRRKVLARPLEPRQLKGKPAPVRAFAPYGVVPNEVAEQAIDTAEPVGRKDEIALLAGALADLRRGVGGTVILEGEAGIGKTTLVTDFIARLGAGEVVTIGFGDSSERVSPYFAWRPVFRQLFGLEEGLTPHDLNGRLFSELGDDAWGAPLLSEVLGLEISDSAVTAQITGEARATNTRRLLVERLTRLSAKSPLALIIEDAHWTDSGSALLMADIAESGLPLLLLITTRTDHSIEDFRRVVEAPRSKHLKIAGLSDSETGIVLSRHFGARRANADVARYVLTRTLGNPLFIREVGTALREFGVAIVADDEVVVGEGALGTYEALDRRLQEAGSSSTLEGIVTSRFDRLPPSGRLVLQAMAVAAQRVGSDDVSSLVAGMADNVDEVLSGLVGEFLVHSSTTEQYEFKHHVFLDVVYGSLSFADRRRLHERFANILEQRNEIAQSSALDASLGHHFSKAGIPQRAIPYLFRAAKDAFRNYAIVEVIELCGRAVENFDALAEASSQAASPTMPQRAEIELLLGRAYLALSRYGDAQKHCERGLMLLGYPVPSNMARTSARMLADIMRQIRPSAGLTAGGRNPNRADLPRSVAIAYECLAETYYFGGDGLRTLYASLRMLNVADEIGPSGELARASAAVSAIAGLVPMHRVSARYRQRSLAMLDSVDDQAAAAWALNLLGVSRLGTGHWEEAHDLFRRTGDIARRLGDWRRVQDETHNSLILFGCRGEWRRALDLVEEMRQAAARNRDQRYLLLAYREGAYLETKLGQFDAAEASLELVRKEVERGLDAEEEATVQDLCAMSAVLAFERGESDDARLAADAALKAAKGLSGVGSYANRYWAIFHLARTYLNLWQRAKASGGSFAEDARKARLSERLLKKLATAHPITAPSLWLVRGGRAWLEGRATRATEDWRRALSCAKELSMPYEADLAERELARAERASLPVPGALPLFGRMHAASAKAISGARSDG